MPQDQNSTISWSQNMHQDSLGVGAGDEDFTKFLDLDNGFDQFSQLDGTSGQSSLETPMGRLAFGSSNMQDLAIHNQDMLQNVDMSHFQPFPMYSQAGQSMHYPVPPTPVSAEMHAAKYNGQTENVGQIMFERHQASFTPLVSPAQTPLDNAFGMPDYVMADDFFSPLTSPAMEAQPHFTSTNTTASPADVNGDHSTGNTPSSMMRKRARKVNPSQQRPARNIKQSPNVKPQHKRRQFSVGQLPQEKLETMFEGVSHDDRLPPDASRASTVFASSEDSVSPEPLSEALMRPPPVPSSAARSPSLLKSNTSKENLPATPAMIMRMPSKQSGLAEQSGEHFQDPNSLEVIALPDAAAMLPSQAYQLPDTDDFAVDDQVTPTLSAKTPKLTAQSTPRTSVVKIQSSSGDSLDKTKRPESRVGGRGNKKRPTNTSATVSPALRPKISPSISPLVPATGGIGGLSVEKSALYLASKSNYQNILDGTHLPGVTYPETLAENLSSKRTSHKIAEQGRRNRINLALKEIESLLPPSITTNIKKEKSGSTSKDSEEGSPGRGASSGQGASKASTVEMAIVYIKSLQAELKETKDKLEAAEKQIAGPSSADE